MKWKTTWFLLILAGFLFAFIYFVERHTRPTSAAAAPPPRLVPLKPAEVSSVQLRRTNQFILRVERTNGTWRLTDPLNYPAQPYAVEALLDAVSKLVGHKKISMEELSERGQTIADFGLDIPAATLTLHDSSQRTELFFGSKTPVGDHIYVQLLTLPGIYVVNADVFDRLPRGTIEWRDPALLNLTQQNIDRMEVRGTGRGFAINLKQLQLTKPTPARADFPKVEALLRKLQSARVAQFVSDDPRADLDHYGMQPPELELVFGHGTNEAIVIQFGRSPTNEPSLVYARRMTHTNIVLVTKSVLDALQTSHAELRDRHLLTFVPQLVDTIEVEGDASFTVRCQSDGSWMAIGTNAVPADAELMRRWFNLLLSLEGEVERDLVTDFAPYGLSPPFRQYVLKAASTNAAGTFTNQILDQLDIGFRHGEKVFARRADETSVYSIGIGDFQQLPGAPWQLRSRRVWSFATNDVKSLTIRSGGYARTLLRGSGGDWALAPGSQGVINPLAVEEMVHQLGQLEAEAWVARGRDKRVLYGFTDDGYKLTIELNDGQVLTLEFGGRAPNLFPYALAMVGEEAWILEFPPVLQYQLLDGVNNPPLRVLNRSP